MGYDVVIRNGTVVDGTGMASYRADVGIARGTIVTIGRIRERGATDIDDDDRKAMAAELADALRAGAFGFSTSRTEHHQTADDRPVASRLAAWQEVVELVEVLGDLGVGTFQIVDDPAPLDDPTRDDRLVD